MIKFHKAKENNKEQDWFRPVSGTVLFSSNGTFFSDFRPEINKQLLKMNKKKLYLSTPQS